MLKIKMMVRTYFFSLRASFLTTWKAHKIWNLYVVLWKSKESLNKWEVSRVCKLFNFCRDETSKILAGIKKSDRISNKQDQNGKNEWKTNF